MKKIVFTITFTGVALLGMAQDFWSTNLNEQIGPDTPRLGTITNIHLPFYTNGIQQMTLQTNGALNLKQLADPGINDNRMIWVDPNGNLTTVAKAPNGGNPVCSPQGLPWVMGGNYAAPGSLNKDNVIGVCDNWDFILKAGNNQSVFIKPNSFVGIGLNNFSPMATLDVRNASTTNQSNFRIYGDLDGNLESTTDINMNYATYGRFNINEGPAGMATNRFTVRNGRVGINVLWPSSTLDVRDQTLAEARVITTTANHARIFVQNSLQAYAFSIDNSGVGHIGMGASSPSNLINFRNKPATSIPEVWIGTRPTTGPHTDFLLAVGGKFVAQSVFVTLQGNWADYVFEKDYKLPSLAQVEAFYTANKHLPEIPSAKEVNEKGIDVAEMNVLLLKKVEELTLYLVAQQKEIDQLKKQHVK